MKISMSELLAFMSSKAENKTAKPHGAIGKVCIIRTFASGVHCGEIVSVVSGDGKSQVEVKNNRRLWSWEAKQGVALSGLAMSGMAPGKKVDTLTAQHFLEDVIEMIPASEQAIKDIKEYPVYVN